MLTLKIRAIGTFLCVSSLSSCMTDTPEVVYTSYQPTYAFHDQQLYPSEYANTMYVETSQVQKEVVIPDTYYVNGTRSPVSHKDMDKDWVGSQKAQNYTIEVTASDKASQVAETLAKTPKNERTAEIKYQSAGKTYYKGLYGSYPSYEAAQKALNELPNDVKQQAGVKSWSSVQELLSP